MDIFSQLKEAIAEAERQAKEQMEQAVASQQAQLAKQARAKQAQQDRRARGQGRGQRQRRQAQPAPQPVEAPETFSVPECDPEPHLHAPEEVVRVERSVGASVLGGMDRDQLRRAVLLREILGPPPGLLDD